MPMVRIHSGAPTARATRFFRVALAVYEMSGENCVAAEREKDKQKERKCSRPLERAKRRLAEGAL